MRVPAFARPLVRALLDVTWPTDCFACGEALGLHQCLGGCLACWARLTPLRGACPLCGEPSGASDLISPAGLPCSGCLLARAGEAPRPTSALSGVKPAVAYDGAARRFLLRAKLAGAMEILPHLGAQLASILATSSFAADCGAVVPVPSHPWAWLKRGCDPALEIARPVAGALGVPLTRALRRRLRSGGTAKRLSAAARAHALEGAFLGVSGRQLPRRVLLIDDVLTTGATAAACVAPLRRLGAEEVRLAVWARTPRKPPI